VGSDRWDVNKVHQASPESPGRNLFRWKGADRETINTRLIIFTREGLSKYLPPLFLAQQVRLDLKPTWEQEMGGKLCSDMHFCTHVIVVG
jgi:hypothetical protein